MAILDSQVPPAGQYYRIDSGSIPSQINNAVLIKELKEAATTCTIYSFIRTTTTLVVLCDVDPISADETIIDGVCAAHVGTPFGEDFRETVDWTVYSAATGGVTIGPDEDYQNFRSGKYQIDWYAETRHTENGDTAGYSRIAILVGQNGETKVQRGATCTEFLDWVSFSGLFVLDLEDGDSLQSHIQVQSPLKPSQSGSGRLSELRRCRMSVRRMADLD